MTKPLYRRGPPIRDICAVVALLGQGQRFYWASDPRPKAPLILAAMTLRTLENAARSGHLRLALLRQEDIAT
jgi:hypothetical protein